MIQATVFQLSTWWDEKMSDTPSAGEFSMDEPAEDESSDPRLLEIEIAPYEQSEAE